MWGHCGEVLWLFVRLFYNSCGFAKALILSFVCLVSIRVANLWASFVMNISVGGWCWSLSCLKGLRFLTNKRDLLPFCLAFFPLRAQCVFSSKHFRLLFWYIDVFHCLWHPFHPNQRTLTLRRWLFDQFWELQRSSFWVLRSRGVQRWNFHGSLKAEQSCRSDRPICFSSDFSGNFWGELGGQTFLEEDQKLPKYPSKRSLRAFSWSKSMKTSSGEEETSQGQWTLLVCPGAGC